MQCPGCRTPTSTIPLKDRNRAALEVDVCHACRAFWFDQYENIRLSAAATLTLFDVMSAQGGTDRTLAEPMKCPRCGSQLLHAHDIQLKATPFEYWRCPHGHGHFITFLQFLKEKDFVRPLTPAQLADLRRNVQTINCANCGAPIDLAQQTVCPHCRSPLTMLDMKQIAAHVKELQDAQTPSRDVELAKQFSAAVAMFAGDSRRPPSDEAPVWRGLRLIVDWLAEKP
jgi:uncharacterized protein YbaR (Trm112 family)